MKMSRQTYLRNCVITEADGAQTTYLAQLLQAAVIARPSACDSLNEAHLAKLESDQARHPSWPTDETSLLDCKDDV